MVASSCTQAFSRDRWITCNEKWVPKIQLQCRVDLRTLLPKISSLPLQPKAESLKKFPAAATYQLD